MKKFNLFSVFGVVLALLPLLTSCGTMIGATASEEARRYERIIELPNHSKSEIYVKANAWFVETFNSADNVIEFQDRESGRIMGKYVYRFNEGVNTYAVRQTISVDCRDQRVRIIINDPYYMLTQSMGQYSSGGSYAPLKTQSGIDKATLRWIELSDTLEEYLKTDDDW